jgi:large subunit ribosomal protein L31
MKKGIHPAYYEAKVICACGESFVTGSTEKTLRVEICSKCHPFFTGQQKFIDAGGRVEKFKRKYSKKKIEAEKGVKKSLKTNDESEKLSE